MTLDRLLSPREKGGEGWTAKALAAAVSKHLPRGSACNPNSFYRLLRTPRGERRTASLTFALAVERATDGLVHAEEIPLTASSKRLLRELRAARDAGAAA